jgi:hypothetical protein
VVERPRCGDKTVIDFKQYMKEYNDAAEKRVLAHKPDKLDEAMAKRGMYWNPLSNEWEKRYV